MTVSKEEKIEKYLDELSDEYKKLLYSNLLTTANPLDELSVTELLRLDSEIKKPLFQYYQKEQKRRRLFLYAGLIYVYIGFILFAMSIFLFNSHKADIDNIFIISFVVTSVGMLLTIYSAIMKKEHTNQEKMTMRQKEFQAILNYNAITKWRELEGIVNDIMLNKNIKSSHSLISFLVNNNFITKNEKITLINLLKIRNSIVHSGDTRHSISEIQVTIKKTDKIIEKIKKYI